MSYLTLLAPFEYLCMCIPPLEIFLILSVRGPSLYVRIWRIKTVPAVKGVNDNITTTLGQCRVFDWLRCQVKQCTLCHLYSSNESLRNILICLKHASLYPLEPPLQCCFYIWASASDRDPLFSIRNNHELHSERTVLHLNTFVMGLRS